MPNPPLTEYLLSEYERQRLLEIMYEALTECEAGEEISYGVISLLNDGVRILGGKRSE